MVDSDVMTKIWLTVMHLDKPGSLIVSQGSGTSVAVKNVEAKKKGKKDKKEKKKEKREKKGGKSGDEGKEVPKEGEAEAEKNKEKEKEKEKDVGTSSAPEKQKELKPRKAVLKVKFLSSIFFWLIRIFCSTFTECWISSINMMYKVLCWMSRLTSTNSLPLMHSLLLPYPSQNQR